MEPQEHTPADIELGKALCDRLGLNHDTTLREWKAENTASGVMVSMTTVKFMSVEEYNELRDVAVQRANAPVTIGNPVAIEAPAVIPAPAAIEAPEAQK